MGEQIRRIRVLSLKDTWDVVEELVDRQTYIDDKARPIAQQAESVIPEAYRSPFTRTVALAAARLAVIAQMYVNLGPFVGGQGDLNG